MTKSKLIQMVGGPATADSVLEAVLEQVTEDFVLAAVMAKLDRVNAEVKVMEAEGYIECFDGSYEVNWSKLKRPRGRDRTEATEAAYRRAYYKCVDANTLLLKKGNTEHVIKRMTPSRETQQIYRVEWDDLEGNRHGMDFETLEDAGIEAEALRDKYDHVEVSIKREDRPQTGQGTKTRRWDVKLPGGRKMTLDSNTPDQDLAEMGHTEYALMEIDTKRYPTAYADTLNGDEP